MGQPSSKLLTVPNLLTLLRLALIPVFVLASLRGEFTVAFFAFVTAGVSDAVDGWIARKFNQQSRFGMIFDPAADKLMMVSGYIVYTVRGIAPHRLPEWLTFTVFMRDALIVLFAYLLFTRIRIRKFPPSIAGKVSTVCQVVALSVTIAANTFLHPLAIPLLLPVWYISMAMTLISGYDYLKKWNEVVLSPSA